MAILGFCGVQGLTYGAGVCHGDGDWEWGILVSNSLFWLRSTECRGMRLQHIVTVCVTAWHSGRKSNMFGDINTSDKEHVHS
jgi:hypothetical protein